MKRLLWGVLLFVWLFLILLQFARPAQAVPLGFIIELHSTWAISATGVDTLDPDVITQGSVNETHAAFFTIESTNFGPTIGLENAGTLCFSGLPGPTSCFLNLSAADLVVAGGL